MVEITVHDDSLSLTDPVLIEGLPGVGLVGKIATDHIINHLDMQYIGAVTGGQLPAVALFEANDHAVKHPVRLFADEPNNLLALRSDIPVSTVSYPSFARGLTNWFADLAITPLYLSGFPGAREFEAPSPVYGVATGNAAASLETAKIPPPVGSGMISAPVGALLAHARDTATDAIGLIVETDPQFPDPLGAKSLIDDGISRLIEPDIDTELLAEQAEHIIEHRERLAERISTAEPHERSRTSSIDLYAE